MSFLKWWLKQETTKEVWRPESKVKELEQRNADLERAYQRIKNSELQYRIRWLDTYRALLAQQKGCIRLRRALDRANERLRVVDGDGAAWKAAVAKRVQDHTTHRGDQ